MSDEEALNNLSESIRYSLPKLDVIIDFEKCSVEVTSGELPNSFYLRKLDCRDYFFTLHQNITEYYANKENVIELSPADIPLGSYWCVQFEKGTFRAKALRIIEPSDVKQNFQFEMFMVDVGMSKIVDLSQIHYLDDLFVLDPPWALHCGLAEVHPVDPWHFDPWGKISESFLKWYQSSAQLHAIFVGEFQGLRHEVVIVNERNEIINELLVQQGLASSKKLTSFKEEEVKEFVSSSTRILQEPLTDLNKDSDLVDDWDPMKNDYEGDLNNEYYNDESAEMVFGGVENTNAQKLCKFYSKGKGCPRGENCQWLHIRERKDDLPTEYEEVYCHLDDAVGLPKENSIVPIVVSNICTPSQFYAYFPQRSYKDQDRLKLMCLELSEVYSNSKAKIGCSLNSPGELVVVNTRMKKLLDEGLPWWRARVVPNIGKPAAEDKIKVFYFDIGIFDLIDARQIRIIEKRFLSPGPLAVSCSLSEIKPIDDRWETDAIMKFTEFVKNRILHGYIVEVSSEEMVSVALFNPDNQDESINEILVQDQLATWDVFNADYFKLKLKNL